MNKIWQRLLVALAASALVLSSAGCSLLLIPEESTLTPSAPSPSRPGTPATGTPEERTDEDFGTIQVYLVDEVAALVPAPASDSLTASVWADFLRVATPDFAAEIIMEYATGDAPDSDTLASVYPVSDDYWALSVNLATSNDRPELIATLIHEYAHLLTLEASQVSASTGSCPTLELDEGCADPDSTLEAFNTRFWANYGSDAPGPGNADADIAWNFYLEHEDDFVSDYAATNVVEDAAEALTSFVIEPESAQEGNSVIAKKLAFFADYPEYVAIRERLRSEFARELGWAE